MPVYLELRTSAGRKEIFSDGPCRRTLKGIVRRLLKPRHLVVHPNWWGQPPAILKGWIDRVIRPGIAYDL